MGGDQHVGKREQPGEDVVFEHLGAAVLEEQSCLLLVHVEGKRADPARLQTRDDSFGVDEWTAASVHEHDPLLHRFDGRGVDEMVGLLGERTVERDEVGSTQCVFERRVLDAQLDQMVVGILVDGEHLTAKVPKEPSHDRADPSRPDHGGGLAGQIEADETVEGEETWQDPADVETAYQAIVRDGTTVHQEALLNEELLRSLWPELMLPERCRRTWEDRFPDLVA